MLRYLEEKKYISIQTKIHVQSTTVDFVLIHGVGLEWNIVFLLTARISHHLYNIISVSWHLTENETFLQMQKRLTCDKQQNRDKEDRVLSQLQLC